MYSYKHATGITITNNITTSICTKNEKWDESKAKCVPKTCPAGQKLQDGDCVTLKCPPGFKLNKDMMCEKIFCDAGWELVGSKCVKQESYCDEGYNLVNGTCEPICKLHNQKYDPATKKCINIECPMGQVYDGKKCTPIVCQEGYVLLGSMCVKYSCPVGYTFKNAKCVRDDGGDKDNKDVIEKTKEKDQNKIVVKPSRRI